MKYFLLVTLIYCSSCSESNKDKIETFEAHDGTLCKRSYGRYCGVDLYECDNGSEYYCEHNVKVWVR